MREQFIDEGCAGFENSDFEALQVFHVKVGLLFSLLSRDSSEEELDDFIDSMLCVTESRVARPFKALPDNNRFKNLLVEWGDLIEEAAHMRETPDRIELGRKFIESTPLRAKCLHELAAAKPFGLAISTLAQRLSVTEGEAEKLYLELNDHDLVESLCGSIRLGLLGQLVIKEFVPKV